MLRCTPLKAKWKWCWVLATSGALLVSSCSAVEPSATGGPVSESADSYVEAGHAGAMGRNASHESLRQRLRMHGRLPVIVLLNVPSFAPGSAAPSEARQQALLADTQERVIDRLIRITGSSRKDLAIKTFSVTPAFGAQIDEQELDALLADPAVNRITEDSAVPVAGH